MIPPLDLPPDSKEWRYERLTWQERLERRPTDYGAPEASSKPSDWQEFTDWERSKEHLSAIYF